MTVWTHAAIYFQPRLTHTRLRVREAETTFLNYILLTFFVRMHLSVRNGTCRNGWLVIVSDAFTHVRTYG